ncbi:MAG TPA: T9SS type A sorting domain-containing protein [Moheibacter sp.]|nr:T9SS type A sorting domain-containing protein [Moheibacter sp.]
MREKFLLFAVVCFVFVGSVNAQTYPTTKWEDLADTSWYQDSESAFDISTAEQLAGLAKLVAEGNSFAGKTIKLTDNIDLDGHLWEPIGFSHNFPFSGNVEGNHHVISNLWITGLDRDFIGLFGQSVEASYKNINLDTANIMDKGDNSGSLVANLYTSTMENCHAYNVEINVDGVTVGGLVGGVLVDGWVKKSSFSGNVTGDYQVGGFAGSIWDKAEIAEVYVEGNVTANYVVGGLVGFSTFTIFPNRESTLRDSYSRANVTATLPVGTVGGAYGVAQAQTNIINVYSTGKVEGLNNVGGFIGEVGFITAENNYFDMETSEMTEGVGIEMGAPFVLEITGKRTEEMTNVGFAVALNNGQEGPWLYDATLNDGYPGFEGNLSVKDLDLNGVEVSVYPTVTDRQFFITSTAKAGEYKVFNTAGALVKSGDLKNKTTQVDINELNAGVYIVQIQADNKTVSKKIVKK